MTATITATGRRSLAFLNPQQLRHFAFEDGVQRLLEQVLREVQVVGK